METVKQNRLSTTDWFIICTIVLLLFISIFVLYSVAPAIFPSYYVYIVIALILFFVFLKIDFEIFVSFSAHLYIFTIILLVITLILGQVTRGAIRWIPLGGLTFQPSEILRPFILLHLAKYATDAEMDLKRLVKLGILFIIPFLLILIQPSLGVALVMALGFLGAIFGSPIKKRTLLLGFFVGLLLLPFSWFLLADYQKERVITFLNPYEDPQGSGYNSIQSMISVGAGGVLGRGLGQGVQTQLAFLPEKHTDFIFASISEELGFVGATLVLIAFFGLFMCLIKIVEKPVNLAARAYTTSVFLVFLAQTTIHIGMNMGMLPITGLPLPFVSAGGSALLGSMLTLAIAMKGRG